MLTRSPRRPRLLVKVNAQHHLSRLNRFKAVCSLISVIRSRQPVPAIAPLTLACCRHWSARRCLPLFTLPSPPLADTEELSDKYTDVMQQRMGSATLTYRHEDGTNWNRILDDLVVGSCLQTPKDVDRQARRRCLRPSAGASTDKRSSLDGDAILGGQFRERERPAQHEEALSLFMVWGGPLPPSLACRFHGVQGGRGGGRAHGAVPAGGQRHGVLRPGAVQQQARQRRVQLP